MEYEIAVKMAELNSAIVRSNLAGDLAAAEVQGFSQVPADAFFREITGVRTLIDSWRRRYDHPTPELTEIVKSLDTLVVAIQQASACYGWLRGRGVLSKSRNALAGSARRLVIEAACPL